MNRNRLFYARPTNQCKFSAVDVSARYSVIPLRVFGTFTFLLLTAVCYGQTSTILDFYPRADSVAEYPDLPRKIATICTKKIDRFYVTFMGYEGSTHVFIAAVTLTPIKDPNRDISRMVEFNEIQPSVGRTSTWGYVFDRNKDGRIDYMALLGGAAAFETKDFPKDFPAKATQMSREQIEFFISRCKLIFNHWADDNYDGAIDAVIHVDMDRKLDWAKRKLVVRSTKFNGKFDEVWAFREKINESPTKVRHTESAVPYRPSGKPVGEITMETLQEKTDILRLMNQAAKECATGKFELSIE